MVPLLLHGFVGPLAQIIVNKLSTTVRLFAISEASKRAVRSNDDKSQIGAPRVR